MTRPMSPRPDLDQLKCQAKELLKAQRAHDPAACAVLRHLRRFADATDAEILQASVTLSEAQYALAMEYGFPSWDAVKQHVRSATGAEAPAAPADHLRASSPTWPWARRPPSDRLPASGGLRRVPAEMAPDGVTARGPRPHPPGPGAPHYPRSIKG